MKKTPRLKNRYGFYSETRTLKQFYQDLILDSQRFNNTKIWKSSQINQNFHWN